MQKLKLDKFLPCTFFDPDKLEKTQKIYYNLKFILTKKVVSSCFSSLMPVGALFQSVTENDRPRAMTDLKSPENCDKLAVVCRAQELKSLTHRVVFCIYCSTLSKLRETLF